MDVRIANRKNLHQSDLGLHCLSRLFWQATSARNFRTFTVTDVIIKINLNIHQF